MVLDYVVDYSVDYVVDYVALCCLMLRYVDYVVLCCLMLCSPTFFLLISFLGNGWNKNWPLNVPRLYRNFRGAHAAHTIFKTAGAAQHGGLVPWHFSVGRRKFYKKDPDKVIGTQV